MTERSRHVRPPGTSGRSRLIVGCAFGVALLVAACSGDGGDAVVTTDPPPVTDRTTATPTTSTVPSRVSAGCGTTAPITASDDPSGDVVATFASDGVERSYRLAVPAAYEPDTPTPVILDLHGSGSNAAQQSVYSGMPARGAARGFIVVTPDAIDGRWELAGQGADDRFLMALLDHLEANYCVDLDRVHATGISLGSWKAAITACTHPDRFASLALVAEEVAPGGCALPVVAFHGTADRVVPYGSGADPGIVVRGANAGLPGVEVNMPAWATNGGCSAAYDIERIGSDVEHWTFRDCPEEMDVELYSVRGGGHTWPGSPIQLPGTTHTVDATAIALDWFDAHHLSA